MAITGHRQECGTQMWPTKCRDCGGQVWYLKCTCGSRVVFDEKGSPWLKHDCTPVDRDEVRRLLSLRDARGRMQACDGTWSVEVRVVDVEVRKGRLCYKVAGKGWKPEAEIRLKAN